MNNPRLEGLERLSSLSISKGQRDFLVMHYLIDSLRRVIKQFGNGDILDIGCGNKPYKQLFLNSAGRYVGCDVVQSSLNTVDIICEANNVPLQDGTFDTILCTQVLEHVSDPVSVMGEAHRLLKHGGVYIISVPFCWELHEEPYDFFRYSKYGIRALLEKSGFETVLIEANGGKWAALSQLFLNITYSTFTGKLKMFSRVVKVLFIHLGFTRIVNGIGLWIDRKWFDELLTLNYVIVAKKPS